MLREFLYSPFRRLGTGLAGLIVGAVGVDPSLAEPTAVVITAAMLLCVDGVISAGSRAALVKRVTDRWGLNG